MSGHKEKEEWKTAEIDLKRDGTRQVGRRLAPFYKVRRVVHVRRPDFVGHDWNANCSGCLSVRSHSESHSLLFDVCAMATIAALTG